MRPRAGRIPLSLTGVDAATLRAERDGAVLTIFLPDTPETPSPGRAVAPLPLDSRGRVTLGEHVCTDLGLSAGADVLVVFDPDRRTFDLCAARRIEDAVVAAMDAHRSRPAPASPDTPATSMTAAPATATASPAEGTEPPRPGTVTALRPRQSG